MEKDEIERTGRENDCLDDENRKDWQGERLP